MNAEREERVIHTRRLKVMKEGEENIYNSKRKDANINIVKNEEKNTQLLIKQKKIRKKNNGKADA